MPTTRWRSPPQLAEARDEKATSRMRYQDALQKRRLLYDKTGEEHYNLISALHKSVRNSDPDAALYWLGRMLKREKTPSTWPAAWSAWRWKILAWPSPTRSSFAGSTRRRGLSGHA